MFQAVIQLKTVVQRNRIEQNRNALKQKCGFFVISRREKSSDQGWLGTCGHHSSWGQETPQQ